MAMKKTGLQASPIVFSGEDKAVVRALQGEFPLVERPYALLAERAGMGEQEFLSRVKRLKEAGVIRKMGAVLQHRKAGFASNVLVAWAVPQEQIDTVCRKLSAHPRVTHCYDRNTEPNRPYNVYTMVHGHSREECETIVHELSAKTGMTDYQMLFTVKEWKKASMKYFS